jgi:hypothetical protein
MDLAHSTADVAATVPDLSPQQAEELARLGRLQMVHLPDPSSRGRNARLLWVGFVVFLLLGLLLLASPFLPPPRDVPPTPWPVLLLFGLFVGIFLVACGWRLRQLAHGGRVRVLVFAEGLARFDGDDLLTCRWDEIESVQGVVKTYAVHGAPVGSRFIISVRLADGRELRLDGAKGHLLGMDLLFRRVAEESGRRLLPRLLAAVEAGETVPFGVLAVSKAGLHWGRHVLAWGDATNVDFRDRLSVRNPNTWPLHPWVRLADFSVPNHLVLLHLTDLYVRKHRPDLVPAGPEA